MAATTAALAKTRTRTIRGGGRRLGGGLITRGLRDTRLGGSRLMRARRRAVASSCRLAEPERIATGGRDGKTET